MKIITVDENTSLNNTVVVLGNFDGFHKGHMLLVNKAFSKKSDKIDNHTLFFTFIPHTSTISSGKKPDNLIFSEKEKRSLVKKFGFDYYCIFPFTKKNILITPEKFAADILVKKLGANVVIVGDDYRFGHKHVGDANMLKELGVKNGFSVIVIPRYKENGIIFSSTILRQCITNLDFEQFANMTGRNYFITGEVVHGKALGRKIGYPTTNIIIDEEKLRLKKGVYATYAFVHGKKYESISFIGESLYDASRLQLETFIFDFDEMIYGENIRVEFIKFVREEIMIDSIDHLVRLIEDDIDKSRKYF